MKKSLIAIIAVLSAFFIGTNVYAASNVKYSELQIGEVSVIDGVEMIPVREIAESLGYMVEWDGETKTVTLTRLPQYITMQIGVDGYSFARMAAQPLGTAPVIVDGVTYAPLTLLTDVMADKTVEEKDSVVVYATGEITEIGEETLTFMDDVRGEVTLNISDELVIEDSEGNLVSIDDLKGAYVAVDYGMQMTMSIPPINTPNKIIVENNGLID